MNAFTANYPRYRVTMNGTVLQGVLKLEVTQANAFQIAKFGLTKVFVVNDPFPLSWWAGTPNKSMLMGLEMSTDGQTFVQVLTGAVDSHRYDAIGKIISPVGRDQAALLMDQRVLSTNRNQTSSEIAAALAAEHNLKASITPTTTLVGRFYDTDHDETQSGNFCNATNEWDLLCRLGSKEGIVPYVSGDTLFFNPPPSNPPVFQVIYTEDADGNPICNVSGLEFDRNLKVACDVVVTVRSWHSRKKAGFSATARTKTKDASADSSLLPSIFDIELPNLTQAQCLATAKQWALEISQHERSVTISIPSLALMTPQHVIQVTGTNSNYDMTYYPRVISYAIDFEGGATTTVQAKFSSPLVVYDDDTGEQIGEQA